jgi:hypothetical protein
MVAEVPRLRKQRRLIRHLQTVDLPDLVDKVRLEVRGDEYAHGLGTV